MTRIAGRAYDPQGDICPLPPHPVRYHCQCRFTRHHFIPRRVLLLRWQCDGRIGSAYQQASLQKKRLRWHIDHLTMLSDDVYAFESSGSYIPECDLARLLSDNGSIPAVEGFGCSDCNCSTHLFRVEPVFLERILVKTVLRNSYQKLNKPIVFET